MELAKSLEKTFRIIEAVFYGILGRDEGTKGLLQIIDNIERRQEYLWKYVDYGIRTPVFRNMQWVWYGPEYKARGRTIETPLLEVNIHLLKEYFQAWFTLLDSLRGKGRGLETLLRQVADKVGTKYDDGALGELKGGVSAELKACYVLADCRKPFLPFSIMQAPVVPSVVRLTASGDLYLFEENLVIDVKGGWLVEEEGIGKLPTYYYGKGRNLSSDLGKCSDLHRLYGIRKGVGVVAEEEEAIHLSVYVPWRRWRADGPLLYLTSAKLPFLTYIHRANFETYKGSIRGGTLAVELEALMLFEREGPWTDGSKWAVRVYGLISRARGGAGGKVEFEQKRGELYSVSVEIPITDRDIIEYQGRKYLAFDLVHGEKHLKVPVLVAVEGG